MKRLYGFFAWLGVAVMLIGTVGVPDQLDQWGILARTFGVDGGHLVQTAFEVLWFSFHVLAGLAAAYLGIAVLLRLSGGFFMLTRLGKGMLGMKWISEAEAIDMIARSDFVTVRKAAHVNSVFTGFLPRTSKDAIVERRFNRQILKQFSTQFADGTRDQQYDADLIEQYLDALADHEVTKDMGEIPRVSLARD